MLERNKRLAAANLESRAAVEEALSGERPPIIEERPSMAPERPVIIEERPPVITEQLDGIQLGPVTGNGVQLGEGISGESSAIDDLVQSLARENRVRSVPEAKVPISEAIPEAAA